MPPFCIGRRISKAARRSDVVDGGLGAIEGGKEAEFGRQVGANGLGDAVIKVLGE